MDVVDRVSSPLQEKGDDQPGIEVLLQDLCQGAYFTREVPTQGRVAAADYHKFSIGLTSCLNQVAPDFSVHGFRLGQRQTARVGQQIERGEVIRQFCTQRVY